MKLPPISAALAGVLLVAVCLPADAEQRQRSGTVGVRARVLNKCSVGSSSLRFGTPVTADTGQEDAQAVGSLAFDCTKGTRAELVLDTGENANGARRRLASTTGDYLDYELFQDRPLTQPWVAGFPVSVYVLPSPEDGDGAMAEAGARLPSAGSVGRRVGVMPLSLGAGLAGWTSSLFVPVSGVPTTGSPVVPPVATGVVVYGRVSDANALQQSSFRDVVRATVIF